MNTLYFSFFKQSILSETMPLHSFYDVLLPASPKANAGLGVQSLCPSVRPSVPKSCHRNSSETTDPMFMKLGM